MLVLTAGVDVQDDRFEVEVVGWGVDKESWGIKYQVIYGDLKLKPVWERIEQISFADVHHRRRAAAENYLRLRGFRRTLHDTGLPILQRADGPARVRNQGKGGAEVPYFNRPSTANNIKAPLFTVGVDTGKALLYQRLAVQEEGPNYCHFPREKDRGYTQEYFRGLTAEKMVNHL